MTTRSPSSPTTCSRRRASRTRPPSCILGSWSNSTRPARSSPRRAIDVPRTTSPAGSAEEKPMATEHTAKAFDSDLQELTRLVAEMGGLAERMIVDAVDALVRRDVSLGQRVVASDAEIDRLQHAIEERAVL